MKEIHFHKYRYPHTPKCTICMNEQENMIHIERQYKDSPSTCVADSLYVCYACLDDMQDARSA